MYIQSCTDTHVFNVENFILVGNSSLKWMTAPWWLLPCVFSWRDWCWAGSRLIKNKLRQPSRRQDGEKDKIHASAQLTIKPNYLWIGLMRHMLGSKFPDQEVAWEGAFGCVCVRECVCVYEPGQCVRDQKIRLRDEIWCKILAPCHQFNQADLFSFQTIRPEP